MSAVTASVVMSISSPMLAEAVMAVGRHATEPVISVVDTEINWIRWTTPLTYGRRAALEGQVVANVNQEPVLRYQDPRPYAPVELWARPVGRAIGRPLLPAAPASTRCFASATSRSAIRDYRVVDRGELIYAPSSATVRINVRQVISGSVRSNSDGTSTLRGTLTPTVAGKSVRLQRKTRSTCSWSTIRSTTTSSRSSWSFRITHPTGAGTWSYRVHAPRDR